MTAVEILCCAACQRPLPGGGSALADLRSEFDAIPLLSLNATGAPLSDRLVSTLFDAGFATAADIEAATDEDLLGVKFVGPTVLRWLREHVREEWLRFLSMRDLALSDDRGL